MADMNLAPYNYWILYASIAILVITLFMTLGKVLALGKAVKAYKPELDHIQKGVKVSSVKANAVAGRTKQVLSIVKPALAAAGLILAAKAFYDAHDDENGVSGFTNATASVIAQRERKRNFINAVRKEIGV